MFAPKIKKLQTNTAGNLLRQPLSRGLKVGPAVHPLEREAERMAVQVAGGTGRPTTMPRGLGPHAAGNGAQDGHAGVDHEQAPLIAQQALRSPGRPLDTATRAFMEPRFGHDFSRVRVHTDSQAQAGARALRARAYTFGPDVVFGSGEYAPATARGKHLLAHELAHVAQQEAAVGPHVIQRAPYDSELEKLPAADKQSLRFDTDVITADLNDFFKGQPVTATNVDADYDFETPSINALKDEKVKSTLRNGLRSYAMGTFDLVPGDDMKADKPRLNLVHVENLNLTKWGGPDTSFRMTSRGKTTKGNVKVSILIEELPLSARPMAAPAALKGIEAKAAMYGLTCDSAFPPTLWQRILAGLTIQETLLMRIRDVTFVLSPEKRGANGETAEFTSAFKNGVWTKQIVIYQDMVPAKDADFAFTLAHEIGHAIDNAPAEGAKGPVANAEAHNDAKFKEAAKKDGGRANAITDYARTNDNEFFAECFAMFIRQPDTLKSLRPNVYAFFVEYQYGALKDPKLNPYYQPSPSFLGPKGVIGPY